MLVWGGFGFLVPIAFVASVIIIEETVGAGDTNMYLVLLLTGFLCLLFGLAVKRYRYSTCEVETIVDKKGKEKEIFVLYKINKSKGTTSELIIDDTFFRIPIEYWSVICGVLCAVTYF